MNHSGTFLSSEFPFGAKVHRYQNKRPNAKIDARGARAPRFVSRALLNETSNDRIAKREHYTCFSKPTSKMIAFSVMPRVLFLCTPDVGLI